MLRRKEEEGIPMCGALRFGREGGRTRA
jgi:hypothetical protein